MKAFGSYSEFSDFPKLQKNKIKLGSQVNIVLMHHLVLHVNGLMRGTYIQVSQYKNNLVFKWSTKVGYQRVWYLNAI